MTQTASKGKSKAKFAARLAAVQALYEQSQNSRKTSDLQADYLKRAPQFNGQNDSFVVDGVLLKKIIAGANERKPELREIVRANLKGNDVEPLLEAILLAGSYELLAHQDIDSPIIINDYLDITHGFYEQSEVNLINAVLDSVSQALR